MEDLRLKKKPMKVCVIQLNYEVKFSRDCIRCISYKIMCEGGGAK